MGAFSLYRPTESKDVNYKSVPCFVNENEQPECGRPPDFEHVPVALRVASRIVVLSKFFLLVVKQAPMSL